MREKIEHTRRDAGVVTIKINKKYTEILSFLVLQAVCI